MNVIAYYRYFQLEITFRKIYENEYLYSSQHMLLSVFYTGIVDFITHNSRRNQYSNSVTAVSIL